MNILLVDDEPLVTRGLSIQINKYKPQWNVIGMALNGEMAIQFLNKNMIDVLVTDVRMPGMDGLELAKKALEKQKKMKVIILSAYAEFEYAQTAIRYGVHDYLLKPVEYKILIKMLEKIEAGFVEKTELLDPVEKALQYIENNFSSPNLSLTSVSEFVKLSSSHFSRLFKNKTGVQFINYLTGLRIERAKMLLEKQRYLKIQQIGEHVGYLDQQYFSQIFKKMVGITPKKYREIKKSNLMIK